MSADHYIMDSDLKAVADAIRTKGGTTEPLQFPNGMVQAINNIQTGGGGFEYVNEHITEIMSNMFYGATGFKSANCINVTKIGDNAFYGCSISEIEFPNLNIIGKHSFNKTGLVTVSLPKLTVAGNSAFQQSKLTSISLPEITSLPTSMFQLCGSLKTVNAPKVTTMANFTFGQCRSLTAVNLPTLTSIGNNAFYQCSALKKLDFSELTSIGMNAFQGCTELNLIIRTPTVCTAGTNIFSSYDRNYQIYVPDNLVGRYKSATNWSKYASRIHGLSELP